MSHPDRNRKRLTSRRHDGMTVYCASAWPGWRDIALTLIAFVVTAVFLTGVLLFFRTAIRSFVEVWILS